jgi:PD-(D/E)XK nuclease superfamily
MITVSNSELTCFQRCPREWEYRYVHKRAARKEAEALSVGTRIHKTLATGDTEGLKPAERAMAKAYCAPEHVYARDVFFLVPISDEVAITGELDSVIEDEGRRVVHEIKTTSKDISPGSYYWRHVSNVNPQATVYSLAAEHLGLDPSFIVWDVLRKPALRPKKNESETEFEARCLGDILDNRDYYQQRKKIVRFEEEKQAHVKDILGVVHLMMTGETPKNPHACFTYERPCDFLEVCCGEAEIEDDVRFRSNDYVERRDEKLKQHLDCEISPLRGYEPASAARLRGPRRGKIEPWGKPAQANPYRF